MICFPLDNTPYEAKDMGTYLATRKMCIRDRHACGLSI